MRIRATGFIAITAMTGAFFALASATLTAYAHHANSEFDRTQTISVTGTVTKWQFLNPHCGLWIDVTDEHGNVQNWSGEFQSIQDLYRLFQWNKDTFQPGDTITIVGNPARKSDTYSMWAEAVIFEDGTTVDVKNNP